MSVISGIFQSEATESAADTSSQAAKDAAQVQLQMFREAQAAMEPWRASGAAALNQLNALMGLPQVPVGGRTTRTVSPTPTSDINRAVSGARSLFSQSGEPQVRLPAMNLFTGESSRLPGGRGAVPGGGVAAALERGGFDPRSQPAQDWRSLMDPGYEFRKQEGINALMASGAAAGNFGSGNMGVALEEYGQNIASQEFQNVYNRLAGLSGTGQVQSQQMGNLGINTAGNVGNFLNQAGQNIAQGQVAGSNALWGGVRDLEKGLGAYYLFGGGGGGDKITQEMFDYLWV